MPYCDEYEYTIESSDFGSCYFPDQFCSEKLSVCRNKYKVWLELDRVDESFSYLNLLYSKDAKLKLNLHIILTYKNEIKEFSMNFQTIHYSLYRLRKVKTTDLRKITCIFLSLQEAIQSVEGKVN